MDLKKKKRWGVLAHRVKPGKCVCYIRIKLNIIVIHSGPPDEYHTSRTAQLFEKKCQG
jgi:hypothetical protein